MKKSVLIFLMTFLFSAQTLAAYHYSYIPKTSSPTIYNFLYRKREKCSVGEKFDYPKQIGVCASCPDETSYLVDDVKNKAYCFKCPAGTLLVKRNGYPMCLSEYPVVSAAARKPDGTTASAEDLERLALRLGADYKTSLPAKAENRETTFHDKEKLKNVCPSSYPDDETAQKQIDMCRKLVSQNDFLCPYVEKNAEGKWICRACPKNAPYKNKQGGCFNCPYGEEMTSLEDGTLVCASAAPPKKKAAPTPAKKKKAASAQKKTAPKKAASVKAKNTKKKR